MFYLTYILSELRRRSGRTLLTALGLAVGVALVVAVNALTSGLARAQNEVLAPLTGVGTDLAVTRPVRLAANGQGGSEVFGQERNQLENENGAGHVGVPNQGRPGTRFTRETFLAAGQLSFPGTQVTRISSLANVQSAAGGLTLTALRVSGTVPAAQAPPAQQGDEAGEGGAGGERDVNFNPLSVAGVDEQRPGLGAVTPAQIVSGRFLSRSAAREAVLGIGYARRSNLGIGDTVTLGGTKLTVVGLAQTPLGGQAADVYTKLSQLQKLSNRAGRVNTVYVRAARAGQVSGVSRAIRAGLAGASVTTAQDLADRVSGSLVDAKNLTAKLGTVLEVVGLLGAVLIASLLALASVAKRVRELGTLKAIGWSRGLVVRQVAGESLLQGLLGGLLGIVVGIGAATLIAALAPSLQATVAQAATPAAGHGGGFGQGAALATGSANVPLTAPVSVSLLAVAVGLAVAGGLLAGAAGGFRAARLRPAAALRHID